MKIAFITTVFNDKKGSESLFGSLLRQTKLPDEIIVVDSNSKDGTIEILKEFEREFGKKKIAFKIIKKECNRSEGRNLAIKKAKSQIIVASDSGCFLKKDWLEKISKPFTKNIDVVAGYYKPEFENVFEKSLSTYTCVMEEKIKDDFLPSSRSIAFRKTAWEEVGGYPEWLNTCEDLFFAKILKNKGFKFFVEKKAIVFWPQRKNLFEATRQFFDYAYGDGRAKYIRVNTVFLFARYFFGLSILFLTLITGSIFGVAFLVILIILYLFWAISKNYKYVRKTEAIFWLPILQIASDISVISGMLLGLSSLIWVTKKMQ